MAGDNRALSGVRNDYLFSSAASASVAFSTLLLFAWIGRTLGSEELGLFSQVRRVSAMWVPVGSLGVSMALGRFIPRSSDLALIRRRTLQTLLLVLMALGVHAGVMLLPRAHTLVAPIIGDRLELIAPLLLQLSALCILELPYAVLRGLHRIRSAALMQITGYAAWPLLATALSTGKSLASLLATIAIGQLLFGLAVYGIVLFRGTPATTPKETEPTPKLKEWLLYGLARLPGGPSHLVLWAGIPLFLVHWSRTTEVALANAVTSLVNLPVLVLSPLAFVLLPRLSLAQVQGEDHAVREFIRKGLRVAWELQLPATGTLLLFLEPALDLWLGFGSASFIETGKWMVAGIPAISLFMFLRPASDARSMIPYAVLSQGLGILIGGLWLLFTLKHQRSVDLGRAFFIAQTTAAAALTFWCMALHSMRLPFPATRLLCQLLPLLVGGLLATAASGIPQQAVIWAAALIGYGGALLATGSPVMAPLRFSKKSPP